MGKRVMMKWLTTVFEFLSVACLAPTSSIKTEERENHVALLLLLLLFHDHQVGES